MQFLRELVTNPFFVAAMTSWMLAQLFKMIIHSIVNKAFDIRRLFGDGGMPSGHSATVASLAMISLLIKGPASFEFAVAFVVAMIVCHDASGVRMETGKQAVLLNELVKVFEGLTGTDLPEVKLKEFVGHTPVQVGGGIFLGICNALVVYAILC